MELNGLMPIIWMALGFILIGLGLIFSFVGKMPGQLFAFAGMLVFKFVCNIPFPGWALGVCTALVVVSFVVDYVLLPKLARKLYPYGKAASRGTTIGSIVGLLFGLNAEMWLGIACMVVLPYIFALLFEFISVKTIKEASKRSLSAYIVYLISTMLKLAVVFFCVYYPIKGFASDVEDNIDAAAHFDNALENVRSILGTSGAEISLGSDSGKLAANDRDAGKSSPVCDPSTAEDALEGRIDCQLSGTGYLKSKYQIYMDINLRGENVKGEYYYTSNGPAHTLDLRGYIDGSNRLQLTESTHDGQTTGYFEGEIVGNVYTGIWRNASNGKTMPFEINLYYHP